LSERTFGPYALGFQAQTFPFRRGDVLQKSIGIQNRLLDSKMRFCYGELLLMGPRAVTSAAFFSTSVVTNVPLATAAARLGQPECGKARDRASLKPAPQATHPRERR